MTSLCDDRVLPPLESENKLAPERAVRSVKEVAEAAAVQVVLYVPGIEVIEKVEHAKPDFYRVFLPAKRQLDFLQRLKVKGIEPPKSPIIPWPHKLAQLVFDGIRKAGVEIENWHHGHLPGSCDLSPGQEPVWGVKGESSPPVRLDDGLWIIPEELVEVVKIAGSLGSHVRGV